MNQENNNTPGPKVPFPTHKSSLTSKAWLPLFGAAMIAIGMGLQWWLYKPATETAGQKKLNEIFSLISDNYVDQVDLDSIIELAIPGLLTNLDPHSAYIPVDQREAVDGELEGSFSGVGIEFRIEKDKIVVASVISGGPSEKVGLMNGDRIVEINGEKVAGIGIDEEGVRKRLRGEKGTKVRIKVERDNVPKLITFNIIRGDVPQTSIDASYIIEDGIGYIKINRFSSETFKEFLQAVANLVNRGARDFILDLRGNVGGYMQPAIAMANEFLQADEKIVSTLGRDPRLNEETRSNGLGGLKNSRLIVIVDEFTASASEIFSGAMQDNDRGLLLGRRTFGKGLVQRPIILSDGSEIRLTIQRYYTPSGRSIQKTYKRGQNTEYEEEVFERYRSGELEAIDSTKINRELIFRSAGGRELFGGGGIIPDIFVPNDSVNLNPYVNDLARNGLFQKFGNEYVSLNRKDLSQAKNINELLAKLPPDDIILSSFVEYAEKKGVPKRTIYINNSSEMIVTTLKALIAYDMLGRDAYYRIFNTVDNNVIEALKALKSGKANFPIK